MSEIPNNTNVLIMAGGSGTRFWPYSREKKPKQFLDILGTGKSLLQMTVERFSNICRASNIYIATNEKYGDIIKQQCPEISRYQVLFEPARRNTAPCIAYAAFKISKKEPSGNLIIAASDHFISNEQKFYKTLDLALEVAASGDKLVTLGIEPTRASTGYGYIELSPEESGYSHAAKFIEKPDLETATTFLESGRYVWNSGMFIWNLKAIKSAFHQYMPKEAEIFESLNDHYFTDKEQTEVDKVYGNCENISIDYGIMEKADNVYVVKGDFTWSDIGSWNSVYELGGKDENGNHIDANVLLSENKNCIIKADKDKLFAIEGLENYLIAEYGNAILICHRENENQVKAFVDEIKRTKGDDFL